VVKKTIPVGELGAASVSLTVAVHVEAWLTNTGLSHEMLVFVACEVVVAITATVPKQKQAAGVATYIALLEGLKANASGSPPTVRFPTTIFVPNMVVMVPMPLATKISPFDGLNAMAVGDEEPMFTVPTTVAPEMTAILFELRA
jgi:hypothetical protein